MHSLALAALLLSAGLLASAARATPLSDGFLASPAPVSVSHATTLRGVLKSDPQFSLISEIVENDKEFAKLLDGAGPLAFFAPNDDAIRWGRRGHHDHHHDHDHDSDPDHREFIHRALLYHTVAANVSAGSLKDGSMLDSELELESLGGKKQKIRICAWKSRDGKGEVYGDVEGTESGDQQVLGMHDQLLEPESSRAMHVLLNCRAPLRRTDISASNGALHELGGILFPPGPVTRHLAHHPAIFGILNLAIRRAELSGLFDNTKGITVFAPTNRAFLKLGFRTLRRLLSPPGFPTLRRILMHHASSSLAYSEPIFHDGGGELKMLDGESVKLRVENATWHGKEREVLKIGEATVIFADAPVANGVVHVLDRVLKMDKLLDRMDEEPAVDPELESYLS